MPHLHNGSRNCANGSCRLIDVVIAVITVIDCDGVLLDSSGVVEARAITQLPNLADKYQGCPEKATSTPGDMPLEAPFLRSVPSFSQAIAARSKILSFNIV